MEPRLLQYFERELRHLREVGGEFARDFPKIAGRLGLDEFECADPYVERLLEGFAFLAARVQLKVDAEFPTFTQHLLDIVYPHYLAPTPSMAVVQFNPDLNEGSLARGSTIPRDTALRSQIAKGEQTACEYRTAHELKLWPLQIIEADYLATRTAVASAGLESLVGSTRSSEPVSTIRRDLKAGLRIRLRCMAGLKLNQLELDRLPIYLRGAGELPMRLYEQALANQIAVIAKPVEQAADLLNTAGALSMVRLGFSDDEALLPVSRRSFQGYRLLQEYFAFPERFMFVELCGLARVIKAFDCTEMDLFILLDRVNPELVEGVTARNFALFCSPAINLFPKRTDRVNLSHAQNEFHIVADRSRPRDYEVHSVLEVTGFGADPGVGKEFLPFFGSSSSYRRPDERAYYSLRREKRQLSMRQRREGSRSSYIGNEVFIALVDANAAPYPGDLSQLGLKVLCTNRDLPLLMPVSTGEMEGGRGPARQADDQALNRTDFTLQVGAPVQSIRCLVGPTRPCPAPAEGDVAWRLISHLSLNYLSLCDADPKHGAMALRELLTLYANRHDHGIRKQIEGVLNIASRNAVRRVDAVGPIVFGRGLEITLSLEESAFEGSGVFLIGAVLEQFFARYASINSFTETVVKTTERGEIMRWPIRMGRRNTI